MSKGRKGAVPAGWGMRAADDYWVGRLSLVLPMVEGLALRTVLYDRTFNLQPKQTSDAIPVFLCVPYRTFRTVLTN